MLNLSLKLKLLLAFSLLLTPLLQAQIKILRIGDSITRRYSANSHFQTLMSNAGIPYQTPGTRGAGGLTSCECYSGQTINFFIDYQTIYDGQTFNGVPIELMLEANDPDYIFLMIGTNHMWGTHPVDVPEFTTSYNELLTQIENRISPNTKVIVSKIPWTTDEFRTQKSNQFNNDVVAPLVQQRIDAGKPFYLVDAFSLINSAADMADKVHPNDAGLVKINQMWFDQLYLIEGQNVLRDCSGEINGLATLDACGTCVGGNTGKSECLGSLEIDEACSVQGTFDTDNLGFTGNGYYNSENVIGSIGTWSVYSDVVQTASFSFRYSNKSTTNRQAIIFINEIEQTNRIAFPSTDSWSIWTESVVNLPLQAGQNTVKLAAATAEGLPNIDRIDFLTSGISQGQCTITSTLTSGLQKGFTAYPNPVTQELWLSIPTVWTLLSRDGKEQANGAGKKIDMSALPSGLYTLLTPQSALAINKL